MKQHADRRGATGPKATGRGLVERVSIRSRVRVVAIVAILAVAATGTIVGQPKAAWAVDYPSWSDVLAARGNVNAKEGEVTRITGFLEQLAARVAEAQALAIQRGAEWQEAQQRFDEQNYLAEQLQTQATDASAIAAESKLRAGQLAAQLARTGSADVSASLFFDSSSADSLLSQLGMASKISDQTAGIYAKALSEQNIAQSATDAANRAKDALKELADAAAVALEAANAASDAAAAALAEQEENKIVLQAQLAVLVENREATESDFQAGVRYRQEQARLAAIAAAAAAAAAARMPPGQISTTGWTRPVPGYIVSPYGNRIHPITGDFTFHAGVDLSAGCGVPIYAAHAGTVVYSGYNGGYGNFIQIANGDGVSTAYGHIVNGGLLVGRGASVSAGQLIARVGSTGGSTGCHLHYEVRLGSGTTDPVSFMRGMGAALG